MELADTSVWTNRHLLTPETAGIFESKVTKGDVATCDAVKSELLYSARNLSDFRAMREELDALPRCPITAREWARALDVYEQFAAEGGAHHRAVKFTDLLIAATAEAASLPVLHYDRDFERIAEVTGRPVRGIAPLGSL